MDPHKNVRLGRFVSTLGGIAQLLRIFLQENEFVGVGASWIMLLRYVASIWGGGGGEGILEGLLVCVEFLADRRCAFVKSYSCG